MEKGLIDADLGGGIYKQRIARSGQGKSGGYRSIIIFRTGDKAFFVYGFAKNDRDNISQVEKETLKELAKELLNYSEEILNMVIKEGGLIEVNESEQRKDL